MAMASSSQTTLVITRPASHRNLGHTPGMTRNGAQNAAAWQGFFYVGVSWLYAEISGEKTHMVDLGLHFSMLVPWRPWRMAWVFVGDQMLRFFWDHNNWDMENKWLFTS